MWWLWGKKSISKRSRILSPCLLIIIFDVTIWHINFSVISLHVNMVSIYLLDSLCTAFTKIHFKDFFSLPLIYCFSLPIKNTIFLCWDCYFLSLLCDIETWVLNIFIIAKFVLVSFFNHNAFPDFCGFP